MRGAINYSGATLARIAVNFFVTPILIHALGAPGYGIWSFASIFTINGYLTLLSLGLQASMIRDLAAAEARQDWRSFSDTFFATGLAYVLAGILGAGALLGVASGVLDRVFNIPPDLVGTAHTVITIFAIQALIDFPSLALDGVLVARQRYGVRSILETLRFLIFAAGAVFAARSGAGPIGLGWSSLVASTLVFIMTGILIRRSMGHMFRAAWPSAQTTVDAIRSSSSLFAIRLNSVVFSQMDRTILAALVNTTVLTHYDIAARINGFAMLPQSLPASVILPAASASAARDDRAGLRNVFIVFTRYTAMISAVVALGLFVLAEPFIRFWIGPEYADDARYAQLFLIPPIFFMFVHVGWNMMVALRRIRELLVIQIATTAVNLVASIALTLMIGLPGVIVGTIIGNAFAAVLYVRLFLRELGVPVSEFFVGVVGRPLFAASFAAILLGGAVRAWPPSSLLMTITALAGFVAFGLALSLAVASTRDERAAARRWLMAAVGAKAS